MSKVNYLFPQGQNYVQVDSLSTLIFFNMILFSNISLLVFPKDNFTICSAIEQGFNDPIVVIFSSSFL